jgi:LacI family transcriptional regulator
LIQRVDQNLMRLSHEPMVREMLAYEQAHRLVNSSDRPDAIFLLNDIFASSVYRAIANQGLKIRKDIAVAGFNNDPEACMLPVPMTTYDLPAEQVGYKAVELLRQLAAHQPLNQLRNLICGQVMVRNSTTMTLQTHA